MGQGNLNNSGHKLNQNSRRTVSVLVIFFTVVVMILISGGIWFYRQQAQSIKNDRINELKSIAELKVNQILQWRQERISDARVNAINPVFSTVFNQWISDPENVILEKSITDSLILIKETYRYNNIFIVDKAGNLIFSVDPELKNVDSYVLSLLTQINGEADFVMGDLFRNPENGQVYLDVVALFNDANNQPAGALILQVDPEEYLFPLIQSWPTPSETAETLLIRKEFQDVLFLNTLRHDSSKPLTLHIPLSHGDVPAVQAVIGLSGTFEGLDYRGEKVLAEIVPIPGTSWFMIAKIDSNEIFAETRNLWTSVFLLVITAILLVSSLTAYIFRDRQRQIFRDLFQKERELREAQEEIRTTLYSIGDGVITTNAQGLVTRLNPIAEQLTGWKESEAQGKLLEQVFNITNEFTHNKIDNPVDRVLKEGQIIGLANHTLLISKDGTERPISDSGAPIIDRTGNTSGVVMVFRDQSEERAVTKELVLLTNAIRASLNEIYIFDSSTYKFRFANDGALKNIGYSLDQIKLMTPLDLKQTFTIQSFEKIIAPLVDHQQETLVFETVHQRNDGSQYPVEVHLQLFNWENESVFLAIINDITERKKTEHAIYQKDELLQLTGELAKVGGWEFDVETLKGTWTDEVARIHELNPEQATDVELGISFYTDESRKKIDAAINDAIEFATSYDLELNMVAANGTQKKVRTIGNPILVDGKVVKVRGIFQDITKLKSAEDRLRLQSKALDSAANAILITDCYGTIQWVNSAFTTLTGYAAEESIGKNPRILKSGKEPKSLFQDLWNTILAGKVWHSEVVNKHKNGSLYSEEETITPLIDSNGKITHFIAIKQNISERKTSETVLKQYAQRQEQIAALVKTLVATHDLDKIYSTVEQYLKDMIDFSNFGILLFDEKKEELKAVYFKSDKEMIDLDLFPTLKYYPHSSSHGRSRAIFNREPVVINDLVAHRKARGGILVGDGPEPQSALYIPMMAEDQVIGLLDFQSYLNDAYTEKDGEWLSVVANQIAMIIQNVRLFTRVQTRVDELSALYEIDSAITSHLGLQEIFKVFLGLVIKQLRADAVVLLLYNQETEELEYADSIGFKQPDKLNLRIKKGQSLAGKVLLANKMLHFDQLKSKNISLLLDNTRLEGFEEFYGVPLMLESKLIGVLEIFNYSSKQPDEDWIRFLDILAGQAAIVIEHNQLFDDLQIANEELLKAYDATIEGWSQAMDLRDKETEGHTQRVTELTLHLSRVMGLDDEELNHIRRGTLLHDIGKLGVPDSILFKPGPLSDEEWVMMKKHPEFARHMLEQVEYLKPAMDIPCYHHEQWDGNGYPNGLKGVEIPLVARIFAIVDVWDALISDRPYRSAWSKEKTLQYIIDQSGKHFDPEITDIFVEYIKSNPID